MKVKQKKYRVMYKSVKHLVSDMERDVMFEIITNMRNEQLSLERAQRLAQEFLEVVPSKTRKGLFMKMKLLAQIHPEARTVYMKYANVYYEEKKNVAVRLVTRAIATHDIERAVRIARGGVSV